ncbi:MAG: cytochrome c3 family protein [Desulfitobacteriaceae bacterium]|nr:cytochrome c3 family protein [Desulfitobacteriaceae bacterium]MDI6915476.1 cytochrome c3 family protein [Desulfitobacteriaceae bacterium]
MSRGKKIKGWSVVFLLLGMFFLILWPGHRIQAMLFSPGRGVHEEVGCTACHIPFRQAQGCDNMACHPLIPSVFKSEADYKFHMAVSDQSCTACHTEHAGRTDSYAGRIFKHEFFEQSKGENCANCHQLPQDTFHATVQKQDNCLQCHTRETWAVKNFNHAALTGTRTTECISCHKEPATGSHRLYSSQCTVCHSTTTWKPAAFQHEGLNDVGWISCGDCHTAPRDEDHIGIGKNCASCHDISGW